MYNLYTYLPTYTSAGTVSRLGRYLSIHTPFLTMVGNVIYAGT